MSNQLVFLLEEKSAREMLKGLLPRILPQEMEVRYIVFEGKQDLEKQMEHRLRHYQAPSARFIILRDQDAEDCHTVKTRLNQKCFTTGKEYAIRIACRELESWYLADLEAVTAAFEVGDLTKHYAKERFRNPDILVRPSDWLKKLVPKYRKIDGSRRIGERLDPKNTRSRSFLHFVRKVREFASLHEGA